MLRSLGSGMRGGIGAGGANIEGTPISGDCPRTLDGNCASGWGILGKCARATCCGAGHPPWHRRCRSGGWSARATRQAEHLLQSRLADVAHGAIDFLTVDHHDETWNRGHVESRH